MEPVRETLANTVHEFYVENPPPGRSRLDIRQQRLGRRKLLHVSGR